MYKKSLPGLIVFLLFAYISSKIIIPVEIVAVHDDVLLVRHFPFLKNRQIAWWEANKKWLKEKYGVPHIQSDGYYNVFIQNFGEGYQPDHGTDEDSDLLCFNDMVFSSHCIKKDPLLWIGWSKNSGQFYR
ncbi:DUF943 family protein [Pantoea phytobeneficialis]|uniref:DUF943 family protein n=1 Tax=Pantoea phytobeneficialis TaxID=2052056 RepID=A0AAP9H2Z2_9GAMM|nr:DUF943 family protein [Pantoea phytobeneficialis]MDO6409236.1 DUF943 family protein [Pantoea phytobeneficialis]QGR05673.1 hypothetical protein CTZ24_04320 [Pantoea phytobeneficialis]